MYHALRSVNIIQIAPLGYAYLSTFHPCSPGNIANGKFVRHFIPFVYYMLYPCHIYSE